MSSTKKITPQKTGYFDDSHLQETLGMFSGLPLVTGAASDWSSTEKRGKKRKDQPVMYDTSNHHVGPSVFSN